MIFDGFSVSLDFTVPHTTCLRLLNVSISSSSACKIKQKRHNSNIKPELIILMDSLRFKKNRFRLILAN